MKRFSIISLIIALSYPISVVKGQNTWTQKGNFLVNSNYPTGREVAGSVSFVIGNYAYVGTGFQGTGQLQSVDFFKYDPGNDTWTQLNPLPIAFKERYQAVAFAVNGKGYVCGGMSTSGLLNDLWEYNPGNDTWTKKADMPAAPRMGAVAFSIGTKGYVGTGRFGTWKSLLNDFWEYNILNNTWTKLADFPGGLREEAIAFSINGKGYLGTGMDTSSFTFKKNDLWEYDTTNNSWLQKANLDSVRYGAISFVLNDKGYVCSGIWSGTIINSLEEYDPINDQWISRALNPGQVKNYGFAFSLSGRGYVGGGCYGPPTVQTNRTKDVWEYTAPLGIVQQCILNDVTITPNPNNGIFKVDVKSMSVVFPLKDLHFEIYNIEGRRVYGKIQCFDGKNSVGDFEQSFNLGLEGGVYFLRILDSNKYIGHQKLVIK